MELTGLIGPYYRAIEWYIAREPTRSIDDGRPMPPADLRVLVSGTAQQDWFSARGRADGTKFIELARSHGLDTRAPIDVLDFGCGCGRIARWLAPEIIANGGRFQGTDLNPRLVRWCADNLPGRYFKNDLDPPFDVPGGSIDLVLGHSVLTHLTEERARAWLHEIRRILRPGALSLLTFSDETYARQWAPAEIFAALQAQPYLVWNNALEGSNYLSAWTTRAHFAALVAPEFEVLEILPGGTAEPDQAIAILRRDKLRPADT
jgi:SAM-dependent methyltransferase